MKNTKKTLKAIVLSMVLAAGMFLPVGASAQNDVRPGGLFGLGDFFESGGLFNENDLREGEDGFDISNYGIGEDEDAPLGSGLAILLGAGLGYVAFKEKED